MCVVWYDTGVEMNTTNTKETATMTSKPTTSSEALANLIVGMIELRRDYAAQRGFTATDDEIAESIKASLIRMMSAK